MIVSICNSVRRTLCTVHRQDRPPLREARSLERELHGRHIPRNDMGEIDRARLRDVAGEMVGV
ncbi:MAG: hypothetical protein ACM3YM_05965 [Sphingomonadales bacterium]